MKTKLERTEEALEGAKHALGMIDRNPQVLDRSGYISAVLSEIDTILNPPPEMEEVKVAVGWVNIYDMGGGTAQAGSVHSTKEECDNQVGAGDRLDCQELFVKVQRPKPQPVERSVSVKARIAPCGSIDETLATGVFRQNCEVHGKIGTLTFTWLEPPK